MHFCVYMQTFSILKSMKSLLYKRVFFNIYKNIHIYYHIIDYY